MDCTGLPLLVQLVRKIRYQRPHNRLGESISSRDLLTGPDWLVAATEGISSEAFNARTNRNVIEYRALCVQTAGAWTGVLTPLADASLVTGALGVDGTLWSAVRRATAVV